MGVAWARAPPVEAEEAVCGAPATTEAVLCIMHPLNVQVEAAQVDLDICVD